jgi:uncharacterized protein (TIGR02246 family)
MRDGAKKFYGHGAGLFAAVIILLLAQIACSSGKQQTNQASGAAPADMEAINQLHQRDMEASKKWDVETLVSLWADDIVSIPQDGQPLIGKEANRNSLLKLREASSDIDIVEYNLSFNEVKVVGDWAFEWGTFSGTIRLKDGGEPSQSSGKLFRVLKRDADGSWKIARTMYNNDSADKIEDESSE